MFKYALVIMLVLSSTFFCINKVNRGTKMNLHLIKELQHVYIELGDNNLLGERSLTKEKVKESRDIIDKFLLKRNFSDLGMGSNKDLFITQEKIKLYYESFMNFFFLGVPWYLAGYRDIGARMIYFDCKVAEKCGGECGGECENFIVDKLYFYKQETTLDNIRKVLDEFDFPYKEKEVIKIDKNSFVGNNHNL